MSLRWHALRASVLAALLLQGCASLNPFSEDGPRPAELSEITTTASLSALWSVSVGGSENAIFVPARVDGVVYAAGGDGRVVRVEAGAVRWSTDLDATLTAGVGSDGRLVVVVTRDGEVVALDATDGTQRWRVALGAEVLAPPAVARDTVVLRTSDHRLIALSANDGERRWNYQRNQPPLSLRSQSALVVEQDAVLAGFPGGKVVAVSIDNGGELWEMTIALPGGATEIERIADVVGVPVLGRRELCAVTFQGRASCVDLGTGRPVWSREFSSSVGLDRDLRYVFVADSLSEVHALDAYTGDEVWRQSGLNRRDVSRPVVLGEHVVVGDAEGYLHVLRRDTGTFEARDRVDGSPLRAAVVASGEGFIVQTAKGTVRAYRLD